MLAFIPQSLLIIENSCCRDFEFSYIFMLNFIETKEQ